MRRRAYLAGTASALLAPLVAGCSRDDGEDGGSGPYGMAASGRAGSPTGPSDGRTPATGE